MVVSYLLIDSGQPTGQQERTDTPSWEKVEAAIRKLDGMNYVQVSIMRAEVDGMSVTGGYEGRYLCEIVSPKGSRLAIDESRSRTVTVKVIGFDEPDYPEYNTISIDAVLKAAHTYYKTGEQDGTLHWKA